MTHPFFYVHRLDLVVDDVAPASEKLQHDHAEAESQRGYTGGRHQRNKERIRRKAEIRSGVCGKHMCSVIAMKGGFQN